MDSTEVVTAAGHPLLASGSPLTIPTGAKEITVTPEGSVSTDLGNIGKIDLVSFNDPACWLRRAMGCGTHPKAKRQRQRLRHESCKA
jgi:flagellar basal body rod protein FlgG